MVKSAPFMYLLNLMNKYQLYSIRDIFSYEYKLMIYVTNPKTNYYRHYLFCINVFEETCRKTPSKFFHNSDEIEEYTTDIFRDNVHHRQILREKS